ncbi:unnamed protein product [Phytophthora fragariaefolia]|uniref:Unnamed protein product n=1 Tax=Phytophthora fragariaefolia TaxID=1490495 RepID=A0A9W7CK01_9STRA|nr:unnamed protein product [Phytophthora fragariaefolia]
MGQEREATSASCATMSPSGGFRCLDIFVRLATRGLIATYQLGGKFLYERALTVEIVERVTSKVTSAEGSQDGVRKEEIRSRPDDGYTESKINYRSWGPGLRTKSSGRSNPDSTSGRMTRHQVIAYLICTQKVLPDSKYSQAKMLTTDQDHQPGFAAHRLPPPVARQTDAIITPLPIIVKPR